MKNKLFFYAAVFGALAFSLIYSVDAEAVSRQKYFGDGATPGPAGGWSYANASGYSCFNCHKPGGAIDAPVKTSYLMTGSPEYFEETDEFFLERDLTGSPMTRTRPVMPFRGAYQDRYRSGLPPTIRPCLEARALYPATRIKLHANLQGALDCERDIALLHLRRLDESCWQL